MISSRNASAESRLEFDLLSDVLLVSFPDEDMLEPVNAGLTCQALSDLIDQHDRPKVILIDFGNVRYMNTTALNLLLPLEKRLKARGSHLRFFNLRPRIQELLQVTRLQHLFTVIQRAT